MMTTSTKTPKSNHLWRCLSWISLWGVPAALSTLLTFHPAVKVAVDSPRKGFCLVCVPALLCPCQLSRMRLPSVSPSWFPFLHLRVLPRPRLGSGARAFRPGSVVCHDKRTSCPLTPLPHGSEARRLLLDREMRA